MRRTFTIIFCAVTAAVLFAVLVHFALVAAHVSEPAATTVRGLTLRRLWASIAVVLAIVGAAGGGLSWVRSPDRFGAAARPRGAIMAVVAGLIAAINGGLNLAFAQGGPGSGNGVIGGAAAFVLGLSAAILGGLALSRYRRTTLESEQTT